MRWLLFILLIVSTSPSRADEIETFFGLKFGEEIPKEIIVKDSWWSNLDFIVRAPNPNSMFETYHVGTTETTEKLFLIYAEGKPSYARECELHMRAIDETLRNTYPDMRRTETEMSGTFTISFHGKDSKLLTMCSPLISLFTLMVSDNNFQNQDIQEQLRLRVEGTKQKSDTDF